MWVHLRRFLQVGALGFAVDAGVLWLMIYQLDLHPIVARVISFLATICVTFALNATYTFKVAVADASMPRYALIQTIGAVINFVIYSLLVLGGPIMEWPLLALIIGSIGAAIHNFVMMRKFVFPTNTPL